MGVIYRKNYVLINEQLKEAASCNWKNIHGSGEEIASGVQPLLAAPVEIPQLYSQMGRFEAKINGQIARVGVSIIPPVGFLTNPMENLMHPPPPYTSESSFFTEALRFIV